MASDFSQWAQAETLIGQKKMSDLEFLESMARCDNDPEECGQCGHQFIMAQVARDMLAAGDIEDGGNKLIKIFIMIC